MVIRLFLVDFRFSFSFRSLSKWFNMIFENVSVSLDFLFYDFNHFKQGDKVAKTQGDSEIKRN